MVIINKKTNHVYECVSKTRASNIIGVHRSTISRWEEIRTNDGTFLEIYNHFEVYFNTTTHKKKPSNKTGNPSSLNVQPLQKSKKY